MRIAPLGGDGAKSPRGYVAGKRGPHSVIAAEAAACPEDAGVLRTGSADLCITRLGRRVADRAA